MSQQASKQMQIDIYYSSNEIESLRWLLEVKNEIRKYNTSITFKIHDLSSNYSKNNNITSEFITLNGKRIVLQQLKNILKNNSGVDVN